MPSPVGHVLGGLIVGLAVLPRRPASSTPRPEQPDGAGRAFLPPGRHLLYVSLVACAPDLDFLWGRHNMETHSIGAAAIAGLAVLALTRGRAMSLAWACALAVLSHVALDWLGSDDSPPIGVMALWPFSTEFHFAYAYVFDAISRRYWLPQFIPHNANAIGRELLLLAPPVAAMAWWRGRAGRGRRRD